METDDTGTAMTTFLEMKKSNEDISYVLFYMSNKTGEVMKSACSSNMKGFADDEDVQTKFLKYAKTSEVKESKQLKAPTSATTTTTSQASSTSTTLPTFTSEMTFPTTTSSIAESSSPTSTLTHYTGTTTQKTISSVATTATIGITTTGAPTTLSESTTSETTMPMIASTSETSTTSVPTTSSVISSTASSTTFIPSQTITSSSATTTSSTQETSNTTTTSDELSKKCHDLHNKQTVGQEHGAVNDKIPVKKLWLRSSSRRHRFLSDGDLAYKKHEISVSFQESKELPPPLLPGATEVTETITNSNITTDMKAQSTSATGTRSKAYTEASDTIPFGGTFQDETTSTDKVPTVTTNSRLDINKEEPWTDVISSMRMFSTKPLDAKAAAVNATCPMSRNAKALTETPTSNDPATYPDGCVARKMPGEPRTDSKPAKSWHEWKNEKKLRFIQDVNGWKHKSTSKYRSFVRDLEKGGAKIVKGNWTRRISEKILKAMQRPHVKTYDGSSVKELQRFIRNAFSHYHDLTEDAKTSLGKSRDKIMDYFTHRFPMLLDHTYHVMEQFSEEEDFRPYY